jgi:hypothetical protein
MSNQVGRRETRSLASRARAIVSASTADVLHGIAWKSPGAGRRSPIK